MMDRDNPSQIEYEAINTVYCLVVGLQAMIRQRKFFSGEAMHGELPFNVAGIPLVSAIYEGLVRETIVRKIEYDEKKLANDFYSSRVREQVEHNSSNRKNNELYYMIWKSDPVKHVIEESSLCKSVGESLKALFCLRNIISHGTHLISPPSELIGKKAIDKWKSHTKDIHSYFSGKYNEDCIVTVLKENDVLKDFWLSIQSVAKGFESVHNGLSVESVRPIVKYGYGDSSSL